MAKVTDEFDEQPILEHIRHRALQKIPTGSLLRYIGAGGDDMIVEVMEPVRPGEDQLEVVVLAIFKASDLESDYAVVVGEWIIAGANELLLLPLPRSVIPTPTLHQE